MRSGNPFMPVGSPTPVLDGIRPVFVEHGANPTVAPGLDLPIKSVCRFGTTYFEKWGPGPTDWAAAAQPGGGVAFGNFIRRSSTAPSDLGFSTANPQAPNDNNGTILYPVNLSPAGSVTISGAAINALQQRADANIISVPMVLPAGRITYFTLNLAAAPVATPTPFVRMGIYDSRGSADRYQYIPNNRIYQSAFIDVKATEVGLHRCFNEVAIAVDLPTGGVYHFAFAATADAGTQQVGATAQSSFNRFLGMTARWGNGLANYNDSLVLGHARAWSILAGFGTGAEQLPDPFVSNPVTELKYLFYKNTGGLVEIPLFYIGFEPS